jgi:hypothetical protein
VRAVRGSNASLAVDELIKLTADVTTAMELLGAYDRGDRRAATAVWDVLCRAEDRLEAALDHARTLTVV